MVQEEIGRKILSEMNVPGDLPAFAPAPQLGHARAALAGVRGTLQLAGRGEGELWIIIAIRSSMMFRSRARLDQCMWMCSALPP